jgi:Gram-negative bacterial TonB protein C-terminal
MADIHYKGLTMPTPSLYLVLIINSNKMKLFYSLSILFGFFVTSTINAQDPSGLYSGISTFEQPATYECVDYKLDDQMQIREGNEWVYRMTRCRFDSLSQRGRVIIYKKDGNEHSNMLVGDISNLNSGCYANPAEGTLDGIQQLDFAYTGEFKTYYPNGQLKRNDYYEDGYLTALQCYTSTGSDTTYFPYYQKVDYPGGLLALMDYLDANVVIPEVNGKKIKNGSVSLECAVNDQGSITEIKVLSATHSILKMEAIRVVSAIPYFEPARLDTKIEKGSIVIYVPFTTKPPKPGFKQKAAKSAMMAVFIAKMKFKQKMEKGKKKK